MQKASRAEHVRWKCQLTFEWTKPCYIPEGRTLTAN